MIINLHSFPLDGLYSCNKVILHSVENNNFKYVVPKNKIAKEIIIRKYSKNFDAKITLSNIPVKIIDLEKIMNNLTEEDLTEMLIQRRLFPVGKISDSDLRFIHYFYNIYDFSITPKSISNYFKKFPHVFEFVKNNLHELFYDLIWWGV